MTINAQTGLLTWTPTANQGGAYLIKIAADDAAGSHGVQSFALLAHVNTPPTITSSAVTTIMAGETYHYDVQASDIDNDPLSFSLLAAPVGMTIDEFGRIVWETFTADLGPHAVTLVVTDSHGDGAPQGFTLTVSPDTTAPTVLLTASAAQLPSAAMWSSPSPPATTWAWSAAR